MDATPKDGFGLSHFATRIATGPRRSAAAPGEARRWPMRPPRTPWTSTTANLPARPIPAQPESPSASSRTPTATLLEADVAAFEIITRLGQALGYAHYERGWHATSTLGPIRDGKDALSLNWLEIEIVNAASNAPATLSAPVPASFGTCDPSPDTSSSPTGPPSSEFSSTDNRLPRSDPTEPKIS